MGKCHFQTDWLNKTDALGYKISSWLRKDTDTTAFCQICFRTLNIIKGFQSISQHVGYAKHADNARLKLSSTQLRLTAVSGGTDDQASNSAKSVDDASCKTVKLFSKRDSATRAELIWSIKSVISNMSAASCVGIVKMFEAMFPGCTPEGMTLGPTKLSYLITEALGPYFRKLMLQEAQMVDFTLIYDETTNCEGSKELQTMIRYWSESEGQIVVHHLETFFMGHATAENLKKNLMSALTNADLPLDRILMLASDGPNVNKKVWGLMNEEVKMNSTRTRGLLDLGTCNIHIMHNAFLKGLQELGDDVSEFVLNIYHYFHGWPSRLEDFSNIQEELGLVKHRFIKHVHSRWLTLHDSAKRVIEQWDALVEYFLHYIPKKEPKMIDKSKKYVAITRALRCSTIKAELHFVLSVASIFSLHTGTFQRQEPLVHLLYEMLKVLLLTLMGRFMDQKVLSQIKEFDVSILNKTEFFLPLDKVDCGDAATEELKNITEKERKLFQLNAQKHYIAACKHILEKTSICASSAHHIMKFFRCLQPQELIKVRSCSDITKIARLINFLGHVDIVADEWKVLQNEAADFPTVDENGEPFRIDHYWNNIFAKKNCLGNYKYPFVTRVVKACLTLSHGSADIEREFSLSARTLTEDKAAMSVKMLDARLTIVDGLKKFKNKPECVPITKELLVMAHNAHRNYLQHMQDEKDKNEAVKRKKEEDKQKLLEENEKLKEAEKTRQNIKDLEEDLKKSKKCQEDKRAVSDKLFEEGNEKLKAAIKRKDFVSIEVAQSMLESAKEKRTEERTQAKQTEKIQNTIHKRSSNLLTNYFGKKQKTVP